jgi:hypothetical protein
MTQIERVKQLDRHARQSAHIGHRHVNFFGVKKKDVARSLGAQRTQHDAPRATRMTRTAEVSTNGTHPRGGADAGRPGRDGGLLQQLQKQKQKLRGPPGRRASPSRNEPVPPARGLSIQPVRLAGGWRWSLLREEYCWLVAGGWFVPREKYCWLVADKPSEQAHHLRAALFRARTVHDVSTSVAVNVQRACGFSPY